jgi:hypothetical protein
LQDDWKHSVISSFHSQTTRCCRLVLSHITFIIVDLSNLSNRRIFVYRHINFKLVSYVSLISGVAVQCCVKWQYSHTLSMQIKLDNSSHIITLYRKATQVTRLVYIITILNTPIPKTKYRKTGIDITKQVLYKF